MNNTERPARLPPGRACASPTVWLLVKLMIWASKDQVKVNQIRPNIAYGKQAMK
jgi:hypothetical protein